jgi:hypothetical protein
MRGAMPLKMPDKIDVAMFAPCGMNCLVCYRHCNHKKPCAGCLNNDVGKPEHCKKCKIKECVKEKGTSYCYECLEYPCKHIKSLEKSYNTRYDASLMDNSSLVKDAGLTAFMNLQQREYSCAICGGIISLHDNACSECQTKVIKDKS